MNKIWIVVIFFVSTIGFLGFLYPNSPNSTLINESFSDNTSPEREFYIKNNEAEIDDTIDDLNYTDEELQALYNKYNITENDLKFAKGELPNYLEGTILDGKQRVAVTGTGNPPEDLKKGRDYDVSISEQEMANITEKARQEYIQKYNVDPENPKLDSFNGYFLPVEEVRRLAVLNPEIITE
ncbi:MAG: hypothetical protein ACPK85_02540 [Methanosarcina sp.]